MSLRKVIHYCTTLSFIFFYFRPYPLFPVSFYIHKCLFSLFAILGSSGKPFYARRLFPEALLGSLFAKSCIYAIIIQYTNKPELCLSCSPRKPILHRAPEESEHMLFCWLEVALATPLVVAGQIQQIKSH